MLNPDKGVAIFTDGSAHYKDRSGGWGWVSIDAFGHEEVGSGYAPDTTNNRMEMLALVEGLRHIHETYGSCDVLVYSDSQYLVLGINDRTRTRKHNQDLWFDIESAIEQHSYVETNWVRGHDKSHWNNVVDEISKQARKAGLERS